jgi:hypothetical protein
MQGRNVIIGESDTGDESVAVFALRIGGLSPVELILGCCARLTLSIHLDYIGEKTFLDLNYSLGNAFS